MTQILAYVLVALSISFIVSCLAGVFIAAGSGDMYDEEPF